MSKELLRHRMPVRSDRDVVGAMLNKCFINVVLPLCLLPLLLHSVPVRLNAQVPSSKLKASNAQLVEEFSRVVGVRELDSRQILVADGIEKRVVVADLASGSVVSAAANGLGPNEFSNASVIWPLSGDSSLMADLSSRRWHVFVGSRLVGLVPPDAPAFSATNGTIMGADTLGHLLARKTIRKEHGAAYLGTLDSLHLVLVARGSGSADTVATIAPSEGTMRTSGVSADGRPQRIVIQFRMLAVGEQALLTPDGWLAIARRNPYRVDWRSPRGQWTYGSPLPFTAIRVDDREKQAYLERTDRSSGRTPPRGAVLDWLPTLPAFEEGALLSAPDGRLLVRRLPSADARTQVYDVVDRRGVLVRKLDLGIGKRIAAFGQGVVYVVTVDADGLERLERHPWP